MKHIFKLSFLAIIVIAINFSSAFSTSWNVQINQYAYLPGDLTVQVGDMVEWTNYDAAGHTVTSNTGYFNSAAIPQGQSFSFTFTEVGDFPYYCSPHPFMMGEIHVRESDVLPTLELQTLPAIVPAEGGVLSFDIGVTNITAEPQNFDIWTTLRLPDSSTFGPLINGNFTIGGNAAPVRARTQAIPASALEGTYFYNVFVGTYPNEILAQNFFEFEKLAGTDAASFGKVDFPADNNQLDFVDEGDGCVDEGCYDAKLETASVRAFPNPFNPATKLSFELPESSQISLKVYNSSGRLVADVADGIYSAGLHEFNFNGEGFASGIYFASFIVNGELSTKSIMLLK